VENAWQASTGSISRGKDKFLIGPRYTDDSLLVDLITPRYGGLYKAPSTARILITFCLKPAKLFLPEREGGALSTSPPSRDPHVVVLVLVVGECSRRGCTLRCIREARGWSSGDETG